MFLISPSFPTKMVVGRAETPPYARAVARSPKRILYSILLFIRNAGRSSRVSLSSEMPTSSSPFDRCLLYTSTNPGISALQGGHQVAKKLMTAGFPASCLEEKMFPFVSLTENGGAVPDTEGPVAVPGPAFSSPVLVCQFRY